LQAAHVTYFSTSYWFADSAARLKLLLAELEEFCATLPSVTPKFHFLGPYPSRLGLSMEVGYPQVILRVFRYRTRCGLLKVFRRLTLFLL